MAKSKTSSNGAVAAANDYIQDATAKIAKHHDTITAYVDSLEQAYDKLQAESKAALDAAAKELASVKASMQREIDGLAARATKAENKVQAAFGKLAE